MPDKAAPELDDVRDSNVYTASRDIRLERGQERAAYNDAVTHRDLLVATEKLGVVLQATRETMIKQFGVHDSELIKLATRLDMLSRQTPQWWLSILVSAIMAGVISVMVVVAMR